MRDIRFRAWDKTERIMIYNALEIKNIGRGESSVCVDAKTQRGNELIWQQFTGIKDAKGKEIYEGDIVSVFQGSQQSEVFYRNGAFWVIAQESGSSDTSDHLLFNLFDITEVVGNIYEPKKDGG